MVGKSFHLMTNNRGSLGKNIAGFREDNQFCDLTLVCDDGASFKAHRVILASQSDKLRTILTEFQDSQFCLYLAGVDSQQLSSILAFIYSGEARVSQRDLSAFLAAAQTLKIGGLVEDKDDEEVIEDIAEEVTEDITEDAGEDITEDLNEQESVDALEEEVPDRSIRDITDKNTVNLNLWESKYREIPRKKCDGSEDENIWDNVDNVSYEFLNVGGKTTSYGILTTHDRSFKYHRNKANKTGDLLHFDCSEKKNGCKGRAQVQVLEVFDEKEDKIVTETRLISVTKPKLHAKVHKSEKSAILAASLFSLMKREVVDNPSVPIVEIRNKVLNTELHHKFTDENNIQEVLLSLPQNIDNILRNYRVSKVGEKNKKKKRKITRHTYYLD